MHECYIGITLERANKLNISILFILQDLQEQKMLYRVPVLFTTS